MEFSKVKKMPEFCKKPVDYIDFWYSLKAFGQSLTNSELVENSGMYFRKRKSQITLCTYDCSGVKAYNTTKQLIKEGFNVRTWSWCKKDFEGVDVKKDYNKFYIRSDWGLNKILDIQKNTKSRGKIRRRYEHGEDNYTISMDVKYEDVMDLFKAWREFAEKRHFMVIIGHYKSYLKLAFEENTSIKLLGFYNKKGQLHGVAGWEVSPDNKAQITFMKHRSGDNKFSNYFWIKTLEQILKDKVDM